MEGATGSYKISYLCLVFCDGMPLSGRSVFGDAGAAFSSRPKI